MSTATLTLQEIQHLQPLQLIPSDRQQKALNMAEQIRVKAGSTIFKKRDTISTSCFLLQGTVELRHSFSDRHPLESGNEQANMPLEQLVNAGSSVRAITDCVLIRFNNEHLDELQVTAMSGSYGVVNLDEAGSYLGETMIDDDFQEDWTLQLLESPLARRLKPDSLRNLMSLLDRIEVKKHDVIIQQGSRADYFYILINGEAELTTDLNGPFKGKTIELVEGQHFGEEALVADTLRNGTIHMLSNGIVGRLTREQFMDVFTASLMPVAAPAFSTELLSQKQGQCTQLDIRFKQEILGEQDQHFLNIPISRLRSSLSQLDKNTIYLVTADGGCRSELATCILRQHGFSAYLQVTAEEQRTA